MAGAAGDAVVAAAVEAVVESFTVVALEVEAVAVVVADESTGAGVVVEAVIESLVATVDVAAVEVALALTVSGIAEAPAGALDVLPL